MELDRERGTARERLDGSQQVGALGLLDFVACRAESPGRVAAKHCATTGVPRPFFGQPFFESCLLIAVGPALC
jgi:hypothetical protein